MDYINVSEVRQLISCIPHENLCAWQKVSLPKGMTLDNMLKPVERKLALENNLFCFKAATVLAICFGVLASVILFMAHGFSIRTILAMAGTLILLIVSWVFTAETRSALEEATAALEPVPVDYLIQDLYAFVDSRADVERNLLTWAKNITLANHNLETYRRNKDTPFATMREKVQEVGSYEESFETIFQRELRFGALQPSDRDRIFTEAEKSLLV